MTSAAAGSDLQVRRSGHISKVANQPHARTPTHLNQIQYLNCPQQHKCAAHRIRHLMEYCPCSKNHSTRTAMLQSSSQCKSRVRSLKNKCPDYSMMLKNSKVSTPKRTGALRARGARILTLNLKTLGPQYKNQKLKRVTNLTP